MRYERMMEKIVEDIEREDEEQERKRTRAEGNRNSSIEDRRFRIQSEAQKRMQANMKTVQYFLNFIENKNNYCFVDG